MKGSQEALFPPEYPASKWRLQPLRDLSRHKRVVVDFETSGLFTWLGARPIGIAIYTPEDGKKAYYPWGHSSGPQHSKHDVLAWMDRELRAKQLEFHHARFDLLHSLSEGVDLRTTNTIRCTMIKGPLLDERSRYSLDFMGKRYLGLEKKKLPFSKEHMERHPSWAVGEYAEWDAELTGKLHDVTDPLIVQDDLQKIYDLECRVIPAVVEMEMNGLRMNVPKLHAWTIDLRKKRKALFAEIHHMNPSASTELERFFLREGTPLWWNYTCECGDEWSGPKSETCPSCGQASLSATSPHFGAKFLEQCGHPKGKTILLARKVDHLLRTFCEPWEVCLGETDILRYQLNQLPMDEEHGSGGTVTGRFSTRAVGDGAQPQQIWNAERQEKAMGRDYLLRELFIPADGQLLFADDASQIEFRYFGHYSNAPLVVNAYRENPKADFHQLVTDVVLKGTVTRTRAKNINFGKLYKMGLPKFAREMGLSLKEAKEMTDTYDNMFPEVRELTQKASRLAEKRGYVKTIKGRRRRYGKSPGQDARFYTALNAIIQGSAADTMKEGIANVYEAKGDLQVTMRITVHDELMGDVPGEKEAKQVNEILEHGSEPTRVPLLWDLEVGPNWSDLRAVV